MKNSELSPALRSKIRWEARLELAYRFAKAGDILNWGKTVFPEKFPMEFCWEMHQYFVDVRHLPLTDTEAPRGHAKTTVRCFLIPIFQGIHEPKLFLHYLNVQATLDKAMAVNRAIKGEFEDNEFLRGYMERYFGSANYAGERWTDQQFVLRNGVVFSCIGAGQSTRGINYRNTRPDYIIPDDLYDEDEINNPEATERRNDWFWGTLYPARTMSKASCIHLQGTAINSEDLLFVLSTNAAWKYRAFKAIKDWDTKQLLWPTQFNTFERLMADKESMGSVIFNREMQNERRDDAESIIKLKWLERWEYDPLDLPKFDMNFRLLASRIGMDPSVGEKNENDYTAGGVVYKIQHADAKEPDFYIDALFQEHLTMDGRCRKVQSLADERKDTPFRITQCVIEGVAGFKDTVAEVKRRTNVPTTIYPPDGSKIVDKITHLESKSMFFENGKVHLNKNIDPTLKNVLKYQLTTNHPRHDDVRDGILVTMDPKSRSWSAFV